MIGRMTTVLFLASTPLHTFWSLGLAQGAFLGWERHLALIDQRVGDVDYIADALRTTANPFNEVLCFAQIGKRPLDKLRRGRSLVNSIRETVGRMKPDYVAAGNDRRVEFHAALAAAPGAVGAYIDDGMFSYMPMRPGARVQQGTGMGAVLRRSIYGVASEHPDFVGGSRAVREAWVMLPEQVHAGLQGKRLRRIEPQWFQDPLVREICMKAAALGGLDPEVVPRASLLLVLPHESFLRAHPPLVGRLRALMERYGTSGRPVLIKRHPRSASENLDWPGVFIEVPKRLPVEILAPLLTEALVVGTLTTALISLRVLGTGVDVRYLDYPGPSAQQALPIYQAAGVQAFDVTGQ
jgi:hypothetical protein